MTAETYHRWRKEYGRMSRDQLKRLKELVMGNQRLRRAVSALTHEKMILVEVARGNFLALPAAGDALMMCGEPLAYRSAGSAAHWGSLARRSTRGPAVRRMKHECSQLLVQHVDIS